MRGRELKYGTFADRAHLRVRPHARAGVEIPLRLQARKNPGFALMRGRELKSSPASAPSSTPVRPHARAGVEIFPFRHLYYISKSSPSCEGGS